MPCELNRDVLLFPARRAQPFPGMGGVVSPESGFQTTLPRAAALRPHRLISFLVLKAGPSNSGRVNAMETKLRRLLQFGGSLIFLPYLSAAEAGITPTWHAKSFIEALAYMVVFAAVGIATAVVGYKVFDKCTPGDLHKEIVENKNVAAGIVAGSVILGVSVIIAAAMIG